ncbi:ATP-binding cassette domain-containing protein [Streptococcus suis]|nr:ATP-binding cassette domain-containing protein [Streptococcus suis]
MLKIKELKKSYTYAKNKKEIVLRGVDVEFIEKGVNIILGPSGCGKSTLLNIISGLDTDYDGDVYFQGENLRKINLDSYRNQVIGFVFQNFNLISHLSVLENVKTSLNMNKQSRSYNDNRALEMLEAVGMKEYAKKRPNELSGGQKQRVAIARALAGNPEVIIADEPTGALDSKTAQEVKTIFRDLADKFNKTIIIVTHDQSFMTLADRTVKMSDGQIVSIEDNNSLKDREKGVEQLFELRKNYYGPIKTLKHAFKNLSTRKLRTGLVSFATSIGIAGILIALSLGTGVNASIDTLFSTVVNPNAINMSPKSESGRPTEFIPKETVDSIKEEMKKKGISQFTDTSYALVTIVEVRDKLVESKKNDGDYTQGLTGRFTVQQILKGNEAKYDSQALEAGSAMKEGEGGFYIQADAAKVLLDKTEPTTEDYQTLIGKNVTLRYEKIVGSESRQGELSIPIRGVIRPSGFANFSVLDYQSYDDLMAQLGIEHYVVSVSGIAETPEKADEIAKELRRDTSLNDKYSITTQKDIIGAVTQVFSIVTVVLAAVAGLALVVSGFMILIVLFTSVVERTREIGVLRALGFKRGHIRNIFMSEAISMVVIANIIALGLVVIIQGIVNSLTKKQFQFDAIVLTWQNVLFVATITLLVALIASILPAIRASRLDPAESLRYE